MFLTIIVFIVTLLVLVLVHELGHFLMARKFGIKVLEFGFGIPPRAWAKKVGDTLVSINWLPFGGFVRLLGEDEVDKKILHDHQSFAYQKVWKRIVVVIAGVTMNLILAWILFYIVLGAQGFKTQYPKLVENQFIGVVQTEDNLILVQEVAADSPAQKAGIKAHDRIIAVNDKNIKDVKELNFLTKENAGGEITLTVGDPEGKNLRKVNITPRENPPEGQGALGISLGQLPLANIEYQSTVSKLLAGPLHSLNLVVYSGKIFGQLINQSLSQKSLTPVSQSVAGPVGITNVANTILTSSQNPLIPYLDFVALLSLNLAVLNLLPFPALDGGRLIFLYIEGIFGRRVNEKFERLVHTVGFAIFIFLLLLVTFSDLSKILPLN